MRRHNIAISTAFVTVWLLNIGIGPYLYAGPVYLFTVIDPPTTAGSGISSIDGMSVASTRSGPGSFHLYAVDDIGGSFGIKSFNIKLNGTLTTLTNRSPFAIGTDWDGDAYNLGFERTSSVVTKTVSGLQNSEAGFFINGFGIHAGNFISAGPASIQSVIQYPNASGQWGRYPIYNFYNPGSGLFIAEGTYTGAAPTIDVSTPAGQGGTYIEYFTQNPATTMNPLASSALHLVPFNPYGTEPLIVIADKEIANVNTSTSASVTHNFSFDVNWPSQQQVPIHWSDFAFDSYFTSTGVPGPVPVVPATFDSATGMFQWDTSGSAAGAYTWSVKAVADGWGSDIGFLRVIVTQVPEPASFTLFSLAVAAFGWFVGDRRAQAARNKSLGN